jgi:hypothetical protein
LTDLRCLEIVYEDRLANVDAGFPSIFKAIDVDRNASGVNLERDGGLESIAQKLSSTYESLKSRFIDDFMKVGQTDDRIRLGPSLEKWNSFFLKNEWRP